MLIDLSRVLTHEGKQEHIEIEPSGDIFHCELGDFSYAEKTPINLKITHPENQEIVIEGNGQVAIWIPCSRCLEPVKTVFDIEIDEKVDMKLTDQERVDALDESSYIRGKDLDTDDLLHSEILIRWPMRVLCKENCKGICSRCGKNLNKGTCNCEPVSLDPRMAVISDIFKNFKEV